MKHLFAFGIVLAMLLGAATASGSVLLYEDFEDPLDDWWHVGGGLWHNDDYRSTSGNYSATYNTGDPSYSYATGSANYDILWTAAVDVSGSSEVYFEYDSWLQTENLPGYGDDYVVDIARVQLYDVDFNYYHTFGPDVNNHAHGQWNTIGEYGGFKSLLDGFGLSEFRLGFYFDTVDFMFNDHEGWYLDDVTVWDDTSAPIPEPSTWLLLSTGLLGVVPIARRKLRR